MVLEAEVIRGEMLFGGGEFAPVGGLQKMGFLGVIFNKLVESVGVEGSEG